MSDSYNGDSSKEAQKKVEAENKRIYDLSVNHAHQQQRGW